jgi:hypothetical protein
VSRTVTKVAVASVVGAMLGIVGSRFLFVGSWLSLVPWGIVGLALGAWCALGESALVGACYGFVLAFTFMVSGYQGAAPVVTRLLPFAALGLVGAVCGTVLGLIGSFAKRLIAGRGGASS